MRVLVTGGAGFIGSHTCLELLATDFEILVADNFSNSSPQSLARVEKLAGKRIAWEAVDFRDASAIRRLFAKHRFDAVIHFAGLKAVGESVSHPMRYFDNNVCATTHLLEAMADNGVFRLIFSSSATVYGSPEHTPIPETAPLRATNPYGRTKLFIEEMLRDLAAAESRWKIALLRYFNPVGAHESGQIGEDPQGIPNNLMPFMMQVASGRRDKLSVFGNDYPTTDGTCIRDYVHVVDLAAGHVAAIKHVEAFDGAVAINLGTGRGHSVLELVSAVSEAIGRPLPYQIAPRRAGDATETVADIKLSRTLLGWRAQRGVAEMCRDSWRWQSQNPTGYV